MEFKYSGSKCFSYDNNFIICNSLIFRNKSFSINVQTLHYIIRYQLGIYEHFETCFAGICAVC